MNANAVMEENIHYILNKLAESRGINIRLRDLGPELNGFWWVPKNMPPVIFLDNSLAGAKLNHVFAHELGHDQLHRGEGNLMHCKDRRKVAKAENQADAFADILIEGLTIALSINERV